jgi:hypothetical protein
MEKENYNKNSSFIPNDVIEMINRDISNIMSVEDMDTVENELEEIDMEKPIKEQATVYFDNTDGTLYIESCGRVYELTLGDDVTSEVSPHSPHMEPLKTFDPDDLEAD